MENKKSAKDNETAKTIFQRLSTLKDNPSFSDITVVVGSTEFKCHRAILAAVSDFFNAAFTIDMKEAREREIKLHDIREEIFSILLDCIYNGEYVLTQENLFEVWSAANMLQITFLTSQCEELFEEEIVPKIAADNCVEYLCEVRLLSDKAKHQALEVICASFKEMCVQLKIHLLQTDEIKHVVANDKLNTPSEDDVIESIFRWAAHNSKPIFPDTIKTSSCEAGNHEETESLKCSNVQPVQQLGDVLECARYLLISRSCLFESLIQNPLARADTKCQDIAERVLAYQARPQQHQTWCPPEAVHRKSSAMTHFLMMSHFSTNGKILGLKMNDKNPEWHEIHLPNDPGTDADLICLDSKIYALTADGFLVTCWPTNEECQFSQPFNERNIMDVNGDKLFAYRCDTDGVHIVKISSFSSLNNTRTKNDLDLTEVMCYGALDSEDTKGLKAIHGITSIGNTHILFLSREQNEGYFVVSYSTSLGKCRGYENQLGSLSPLVTFRHGNEAFALQENGCLWRIRLDSDTLSITFTLELVLWHGGISLNGAVLYNDQLIIVGDFQNHTEDFEEFEGCLAILFNERNDIDLSVGVSLEGVYKSTKKIQTVLVGTVENEHSNACISLVVLPKNTNSYVR